MVLSFVLHAAVLLLLIFGPSLSRPPPQLEEAIPVELVELGDRTASPWHAEKAQLPQEVAPQSPSKGLSAAPKAAPAPARVALPAAKHRLAKAKPRNAPSSENNFDAQLRAAEKQLQPVAAPPDSTSRNGNGVANRAVASLNGVRGPQATYGVKDVVRAQIERHWNFDVATLGGRHVVVSIHVVLDAQGNVDSASIIEDPRYHSDPAYHALARSARNAVLVSSPVQLPPGTPSALRDMVLDLDPRAALR
ncbi:MAG: hypothetical protein M0006_00435 [Magnetospirillum sp.]|nr:hypothetical protein [Magnetospirillum sp.]